jgi:hypothetical protein
MNIVDVFESGELFANVAIILLFIELWCIAVHALRALLRMVEYASTSVAKTVRIDVGTLLIEDEDALLDEPHPTREQVCARARDNVQMLINDLFQVRLRVHTHPLTLQLPTEIVDDAVCVALPPATTRLPREKPVPVARAMSKWSQFAQFKGIHKQTKSKLVWDEVAQVRACTHEFGNLTYRHGNRAMDIAARRRPPVKIG